MKKLLTVSAAALVASAALALPTWAMPSGDGVRPGHNVSVFHNLDFVAAFGYPLDQPLTVDVFRDGVNIGTATAPQPADVDEGLPLTGAIEVNHGPEGAPVEGDCWPGTTPDILPGDRIVVTGDGGTDEVLVDNIVFTKGPIDDKTTADTSDVYIEGRASYADGTPIPIAALDSGELRQGEPRFRANPNFIRRIPGTTDGWRATYRAPYRVFQIKDPLTLAQQKQAVLRGDHAMGYGHVAPLPTETQLVEGLGGGGPALGCEGSPEARYAVTGSAPRAINVANSGRDLTFSGVSHDASQVSVVLDDQNPNTRPLNAVTVTPAGTGAQTWSVTIPSGKDDPAVRGFADLSDGRLTARASYDIAGGTIGGVDRGVLKDTRAPAAPKATPRAGTYDRPVSVSLSRPADTTVRYTVDRSPVTASSRAFTRPIRVTGTQTIRAAAFDKAGNRSAVKAFRYVIR